MISRTGRAARWLVIIGLAGAALTACGKKGPPVPPESRLPLPVSALRGHIDEQNVVLDWTTPRTRVDGSPLRDLTAVKLYRREDAENAPLKPAIVQAGRVVGYEEIAVLPPGAPSVAAGPADTGQWVDRQRLVPGRRYVYVVTTADSTGRTSAPSERLVVPFRAAPEAPRDLTATAGDREVTLTWQPPAAATDGAAGSLVYMVLRGTGSDGPFMALTPTGIASTSYVDRELENDRDYRYAVRAVRVDPRIPAFGARSPAVAAVPRDTTPPSAPANLVAVPSPGAVRLAWRASADPDVALYAIYRAAGTGAFIRIGTALADTMTFIDRDVRPGVSYRYAVTALDRAQRPNESARSNEATAAVP